MTLETRLAEIKKRCEAATKTLVKETGNGATYTRQESEFERKARTTDVPWLIDVIETLIQYGNKDCTAMALEKIAEKYNA